jgi:hypothetical protein
VILTRVTREGAAQEDVREATVTVVPGTVAVVVDVAVTVAAAVQEAVSIVTKLKAAADAIRFDMTPVNPLAIATAPAPGSS